MSRTGESCCGERGFTLIEVVVVLAIVALVTALAIPSLFRGNASLDSLLAARQVAAALRTTRNLAMFRGRSEAFILDTRLGVYRTDMSGAPQKLPHGLHVALVTIAAEHSSATVGSIRFYADGSSNGGSVLVSKDNQHAEVLVDWLTGSVTIGTDSHAATR